MNQINRNSSLQALNRMKKGFTSIDRDHLAEAMLTDFAFIDLVGNHIKSSIEMNCSFKSLLTFFVSTFVALLNRVPSISENLFNRILPFVVHSIKSKQNSEYQVNKPQ